MFEIKINLILQDSYHISQKSQLMNLQQAVNTILTYQHFLKLTWQTCKQTASLFTHPADPRQH